MSLPAKVAPRAVTGTPRRPLVLRHPSGHIQRPAGSFPCTATGDGRLVFWRLHLRIDSRQVEVELASIFLAKWCCLEFHDDVAPQLHMVEEQINKEFVSADFEPVLTCDKREASARFQQKPRNVPRQCLLDVALLRVLSQMVAPFAVPSSTFCVPPRIRNAPACAVRGCVDNVTAGRWISCLRQEDDA